MKAGRDEPLYFSWGDKQTADYPEPDRTGSKYWGERGRGLVRSGLPHPIIFVLALLPSPSPLPSASQQLKPANLGIRSWGPEKLIQLNPRPSCVSRWHLIGCLLRGKTKQNRKPKKKKKNNNEKNIASPSPIGQQSLRQEGPFFLTFFLRPHVSLDTPTVSQSLSSRPIR